jgi:hypothetical protein
VRFIGDSLFTRNDAEQGESAPNGLISFFFLIYVLIRSH